MYSDKAPTVAQDQALPLPTGPGPNVPDVPAVTEASETIKTETISDSESVSEEHLTTCITSEVTEAPASLTNDVKKDAEGPLLPATPVTPDYSDLIAKYDIGYLAENAKIPDVGKILENHMKMYEDTDPERPMGIHYEQKVHNERIALNIDPFEAPIHIRTYAY